MITILGYVLNLLAIPFLALTGNWETAALLIILERIGKVSSTYTALLKMPCYLMPGYHKPLGLGFSGWVLASTKRLDQVGAVVWALIW
ncbi:hypothetical protein [Candidatus Coxiella mudrowiae]|uniref:hypothetical protein n=1 Tax=Candidatus Coxiella mudrowiae TaxID=2054173 RepID=UPI000C2819B4|nr:hypothetical protein [Candidatus Coxiella mudrowiae]